MRKKYIILAALDIETQGLETFAPVIHTGVGKINATIAAMEAINKYTPELVINYGTAGTVNNSFGLHKVDTFIQRDMDVRPLGIPRGVTPFDAQNSLPQKQGITLGTGDTFVSDNEKELEGLEIALDLIDMEGYALFKVCHHLNVPFEAYKYVTDSTDDEAAEDWAENVAKGAKLFIDLLQKHYGVSSLEKSHLI